MLKVVKIVRSSMSLKSLKFERKDKQRGCIKIVLIGVIARYRLYMYAACLRCESFLVRKNKTQETRLFLSVSVSRSFPLPCATKNLAYAGVYVFSLIDAFPRAMHTHTHIGIGWINLPAFAPSLEENDAGRAQYRLSTRCRQKMNHSVRAERERGGERDRAGDSSRRLERRVRETRIEVGGG